MLTRSRLLLAAGFVTAVSAGTFLSPASVCATSGGCFIPTVAASQFLSTVGSDIQNNLASDPGICREQCDEMKNGCEGVANAATRCSKRALGADAGAERRGCDDSPQISGGGSGPGSCKKNVRSNLSDAEDFIAENERSARETCLSTGNSCRDSCDESEE